MIINRQNRAAVADGGSTLPSNMTLKQFGQAVAQLDLANIPAERRKDALKAHVLRLAATSLQDKALADEIGSSYLQHLAATRR